MNGSKSGGYLGRQTVNVRVVGPASLIAGSVHYGTAHLDETWGDFLRRELNIDTIHGGNGLYVKSTRNLWLAHMQDQVKDVIGQYKNTLRTYSVRLSYSRGFLDTTKFVKPNQGPNFIKGGASGPNRMFNVVARRASGTLVNSGSTRYHSMASGLTPTGEIPSSAIPARSSSAVNSYHQNSGKSGYHLEHVKKTSFESDEATLSWEPQFPQEKLTLKSKALKRLDLFTAGIIRAARNEFQKVKLSAQWHRNCKRTPLACALSQALLE